MYIKIIKRMSSSWLSKISFQTTTKGIIDSAFSGDEDKLLGTKESLIVGMKVPVGTGFVNKQLVLRSLETKTL